MSIRARLRRADERLLRTAGFDGPPAPRRVPAEPSPYWFKAKRYGWGWGLPCTPQGWGVLLGFLLVPVVAGLVGGDGAAVVAVVLATIPLTIVLLRKGEPPRWRWGGPS